MGTEYLYQYNVAVNAGSPRVDGFNLWTAGQAAQVAGNPAATAANAINMATAVVGNNKVASKQDPGGAGPGGSAIPATAAGAAPFNNVPGFLPTFSTPGNGTQYVFTTPANNLNHAFNFDTTIGPAGPGIVPVGQNVNGRNWGLSSWADGNGDSIIRWFAVTVGADSMNPGDSMTFDAFSPFGPVPAGAFPDPPAVDQVFVGFDDINGDVTVPVQDTVVPEPTVCSLLLAAAGILGLRRRRS